MARPVVPCMGTGRMCGRVESKSSGNWHHIHGSKPANMQIDHNTDVVENMFPSIACVARLSVLKVDSS